MKSQHMLGLADILFYLGFSDRHNFKHHMDYLFNGSYSLMLQGSPPKCFFSI